jgi:hypothetical protein
VPSNSMFSNATLSRGNSRQESIRSKKATTRAKKSPARNKRSSSPRRGKSC